MDSHLEPRESAQTTAYGEHFFPPEGVRKAGWWGFRLTRSLIEEDAALFSKTNILH